MAKPFNPRGHGIREFLLSTRGQSRPDSPILTDEDLADLYAAEPFRRCGFCKDRSGFLWFPPFSAHASPLRMGLVTWKDGRKIVPRPVCMSCVDDWFNGGASGFSDFSRPSPWDR